MELLEQYFNTAFSAPNGIEKLRELILTLAMQGKLVPQLPNDAPASQLLKEIEAEKKRLVKAGKIKPPKPLPEITTKEMPNKLPNGWICVRNGFLFGLRKGKVPKDLTETMGSIPYLDIEALDRGNIRRYTEDTKAPQSTDNDILVVCDGSRSGLVLDGQNGAIGSTLSVIETPLFIQPFVKLIFRQGYERMNSSMKGAAIPHLDSKSLLLEVIGLPPLAEQNRILEKIDQLMARCDALENLRNERERKRLATHAAALSQLLDTTGNSSADDAWAFIAQHFSDLYVVKENVAELRKAILKLAMMGKLVPQNPQAQPASELLKKIAEDRLQRINGGLAKKQKTVSVSKSDAELPSSWEKISVQDFADVRLGSTPSRSNPAFWQGNIPWVSSGEVANNIISDTTERITQSGFSSSSVSIIPARSLLMAIIGQGKTRGQSALLGIDACTNQNVAALVFNEKFLVPEFVWIWAKSKYEAHRGDGRGGAQPALNGEIVRGFSFHLPPFEEQQRIVKKVEKLMTLCELLEQRIHAAKGKQTTLLNSVMVLV